MPTARARRSRASRCRLRGRVKWRRSWSRLTMPSQAGARGEVTLVDAPLMRTPHAWYQSVATWGYDPEGSFDGTRQILPFGRAVMEASRPAIDAGAAGFVGVLTDYPGDSCRYYVPYDAQHRDISAVWVSGSDGKRLRDMLAGGPVRARIKRGRGGRSTLRATTSSASCRERMRRR